MLLIWKAFQSIEEWHFPFWNIFFFLEIFTFLYYANEESDDVIDRSTKTVQHSIKNNSGNIKAVFLKLGNRNVHHKRNKMMPTTFCHGNTLSSSLFLWKTKYPRLQSFWVGQGLFLGTEHCLNSPHYIVGSGWSLCKMKSGNFSCN